MATYTIDAEVSYAAITYLFGNLFSICFGSALVVAAGFYLASTTDRAIFKHVVTAGLILEVLHVIFAIADTARTFGDGFGNVDRVYALSPLYVTGMIIGGCTAAIVQSFYAWRCYRLLGNRIILVVILGIFILFSLTSTFYAQLCAYLSGNAGVYMTAAPTLESFIYMRLPYIAAIAIDVMLCVLTLVALHQAQALGSAQGVGKVVKRLAILTISSNALTTGFCIFLLILSYQYNGAFWALTLTQCDFYMLTLLVWLYQRSSSPEFRRGSNSGGSSGGSSGDSDKPLRPANAASSFGSPAGTPQKHAIAGGVRVHSSTHVFTNDSKYEEDDDELFGPKSLA